LKVHLELLGSNNRTHFNEWYSLIAQYNHHDLANLLFKLGMISQRLESSLTIYSNPTDYCHSSVDSMSFIHSYSIFQTSCRNQVFVNRFGSVCFLRLTIYHFLFLFSLSLILKVQMIDSWICLTFEYCFIKENYFILRSMNFWE